MTFLYIAPLVTPTDDTDDINITIPDELINTTTTAIALRLYEPCGSPELLKGIANINYSYVASCSIADVDGAAKLVLPTCGHWSMRNPLTLQALHVNPIASHVTNIE